MNQLSMFAISLCEITRNNLQYCNQALLQNFKVTGEVHLIKKLFYETICRR